jgi:hypothetical protein
LQANPDRAAAAMRVPSASRTKQLPPEDQPSGRGLIPVSDSEVFADVLAHNTPDGPWAAGLLFHAALTHDDGPQLDLLRNLVTALTNTSGSRATKHHLHRQHHQPRGTINPTPVTTATSPDEGLGFRLATRPGYTAGKISS